MKKHYNLYYLFLEDQLRNPMGENRREEIRRIIECFYKATRPPGNRFLKKNEENF